MNAFVYRGWYMPSITCTVRLDKQLYLIMSAMNHGESGGPGDAFTGSESERAKGLTFILRYSAENAVFNGFIMTFTVSLQTGPPPRCSND